MRVLSVAALIVLIVSLGGFTGWYWWPYIAWPATGVAIVVALFSESPRRAGITSATVAFAVWSVLVLLWITAAADSNKDGSVEITGTIDGAWLAIRVIALVGAPLAAGTGLLSALASLAGRHRVSSN